MAISKNKITYLKKSMLFLAAISAGMVVILILLNIAEHTHNHVASMVQSVSSFESFARYIRWALLGAIIMFWDSLVDYIGKVQGFDEQQIQRAKTMRWRIAAFIVAFEFIVVEAVPARLMG
tara:strand:+ start:20118 stop:20480 length:363 start_codon:yes stop_codon:yes gene_type:complete